VTLSLGFEAAKQGWGNLLTAPGAINSNEIPFLGDNNLVAVGMAMLIPLVAALGQTAPKAWQKRAFQFLNVGVLYRAISTYSRGGFLAVGGVGLLFFWRSHYKMRTALAGVLALAIILPVMPPAFWARMATITAQRTARDDSQLGRLHFWKVAVLMANDHPLVGVGPSAYEPHYNQYDTSDGRFMTKRAVHSAWFGVLAELGYPGLCLFVAIVWLSFRACRRVRAMAARGEIPGPLGPYATGLEGSLVAFTIGGSFVSFHYCEMLWHFFALTIALESVAVTEAAVNRARVTVIQAPPPVAKQPVPDFAWA
jgi:probable O-glycosylation ligase (exosortase A-associated)